jgi:hypothetical protein
MWTDAPPAQAERTNKALPDPTPQTGVTSSAAVIELTPA